MTTSAAAPSRPGTTSMRCLMTNDLVQGDNCFFAATGITDGELLQASRYHEFGATTQSLVMRSKSGTVRKIDASHALAKLSEIQFGLLRLITHGRTKRHAVHVSWVKVSPLKMWSMKNTTAAIGTRAANTTAIPAAMRMNRLGRRTRGSCFGWAGGALAAARSVMVCGGTPT